MTQFYKFGSPSNRCQNSVTIESTERQRRLGAEKVRKKQHHFRMVCAHN